MEVDSKQYIVTAKHVVDGFSGTSLEIRHNNKWKPIPITVVGHCSGCIDISILTTNFQLSHTYTLPPTLEGMCFGQDMYFLGFPFGLQFDVGDQNRDFPLPFVKKCVLSAQDTLNSVLYLDGINNPGFSGGPVVYEVPGKIRPLVKGEKIKLEYKIAGVISGYRPSSTDVTHRGKPTGLVSHENSGLIIAYPITKAVELIRRNPIGFEI